jgi:predicted acyltransferase
MANTTEDIVSKKNTTVRLRSLDALRGFDMFWIISGEGIFHGIANVVMTKHSLTRNPVDWQIATTSGLSLWERMAVGISNQLHHSPWNGFTFYDMIFPLFIFIAGVSMPFSFSRQLEKGGIYKAIVKKNICRSLIKRTIVLILLGMVVNGALKFQGYENTRFASVLGRIALSCFFAAIIYLNCSLRKQLIWFAVLLPGYWAAMMLLPVPGFGAGVLTAEGNLSAYVDRILLPGKLHRTVYDPEGLLSTIPAIGSALLGVFAGQFLQWQSEKWNKVKKGLALTIAGIVLLGAALLWDLFFPINKNMWTSSFVLFAGGWSVLLLALFYLIIDVAGYKKWSMPFVWIGMNSILIYMAAHGIVNFEYSSQFLFGGLISKAPETWQPALLWTGVAIIQFAVLYFLYKKKWFLKL